MGYKCRRLTEGISKTWCWCDNHHDNTQSQYFSSVTWTWLLTSALGYMQIWLAYLKVIRLADACVETWKVEKILTSATSNSNDSMHDVTKVNEKHERRCPMWMNHKQLRITHNQTFRLFRTQQTYTETCALLVAAKFKIKSIRVLNRL